MGRRAFPEDCRYAPRIVVADKLRSYSAAHKQVMPAPVEHCTNSHQSTRQGKGHEEVHIGHAQKFLSSCPRSTASHRTSNPGATCSPLVTADR